MKKFFAMAALIIGVVVSQFVAVPQAEAANEKYLGEWEDGWKAYWIISSTELESANGDYSNFVNSCQVKAVSPQGTVKYINYVIEFQRTSDNFWISFRDSLGGNGTFYLYHNTSNVYQVENKLAVNLIMRTLA